MSATAKDVLEGRSAWAVEQGDAVSRLRLLPDGCVHCAVTSPPYYALRCYQGEQDVAWPEVVYTPMPGLSAVTVAADNRPLGQEATPEAFVAHLVLIFREVKRVLHKTGTCWVNIGDSYAGNGAAFGDENSTLEGRKNSASGMGRRQRKSASGVKAKDLMGIPWRLAFALQADGWSLRSDIRWIKTSPMPSSVRDRPTCAVEDVFLLAKEQRYLYDQDACRVAVSDVTLQRDKYTRITSTADEEQYAAKHDHETLSNKQGRNLWDWIECPEEEPEEAYKWAAEPQRRRRGEKHYAPFPSAIASLAIRLGASQYGCCPSCSAPWRRMTRRVERVQHGGATARTKCMASGHGNGLESCFTDGNLAVRETTGWRPTCVCGVGNAIPCVVLDPFCGSGTSGVAARSLGRRFIGVELSAEYAEMSRRRIAAAAPLDDAATAAATRVKVEQPSLFAAQEEIAS